MKRIVIVIALLLASPGLAYADDRWTLWVSEWQKAEYIVETFDDQKACQKASVKAAEQTKADVKKEAQSKDTISSVRVTELSNGARVDMDTRSTIVRFTIHSVPAEYRCRSAAETEKLLSKMKPSKDTKPSKKK